MFPSNAKCTSICNKITVFALTTILYIIWEKCSQKRKIWHELNILPTIRHSNLLIHFIIFSSLFKLCSISFSTYDSYVTMWVGKETNSLGKYGIQNEVSWYACVLCKWVRWSSLVVLILTVVVVVVIVIIIITAVMSVSAVVWAVRRKM